MSVLSEGHARQEVRRQLSTHVPSDANEAAHREAMMSLVDVHGDPFLRTHFSPGHFTASAFVLSPDMGSLLLIYHRKLNRWLQPGGHVDPGDVSLLEAARREVIEETGLKSVPTLPEHEDRLFDLDVHPIPPWGSEPAHRHFDVRFCFLAADFSLRASAEVGGARWIPLEELPGIGTDESVLRAVRKLG